LSSSSRFPHERKVFYSSNHQAQILYRLKASWWRVCQWIDIKGYLTFLKTIDQWHYTTFGIGQQNKNRLIDHLEARIKELESQVKESAKYEAGEKIVISKDGLPVLIDLIHIRELIRTLEDQLLSHWLNHLRG